MLIASVVIILLFTLGSFAVATVLPDSEINLQEGLMKAFQQIFTRFGIGWATPVVCLLLAFGGIGGVMSWISGPSRGLLWTAQEGEIPPFLAKTNKNGVQVSILIVAGRDRHAARAGLLRDGRCERGVLPAQRRDDHALPDHVHADVCGSDPPAVLAARAEAQLPGAGRHRRDVVIAGVGFAGVAFSFLVGFFPPTQLPVGSPTLYVALVVGGTVVFTGLPLLIGLLKQSSWQAAHAAPRVPPAANIA